MTLKFRDEKAFQQWLQASKHIRLVETTDTEAEDALATDATEPLPAKEAHWLYEYIEMWVLAAVSLALIALLLGGYIR